MNSTLSAFQLKFVLQKREKEIVRRSKAADSRWSLNRSQQSGFGSYGCRQTDVAVSLCLYYSDWSTPTTFTTRADWSVLAMTQGRPADGTLCV